MKQVLKIIFFFFVLLPLFIGCSSRAKTKGGRSFFYVWGDIIKGKSNRKQIERPGSFKKTNQIQQRTFDLGDKDYNIKILGSTNYRGMLSFKEVGSQTGFAVKSADINGDTIDDLIIGAPKAEGPLERPHRSGWVYIFFGRKSNSNFVLSAQNADVSLFGGKSNIGILLGNSLAVDDINGDGIKDIIIGAPKGNVPFKKRSNAGIIFVLFGRKTLSGIIDLSKQADVIIYGAEERDLCGYSLAAGDINGDGIADMLIGAPGGDGYNNRYESAGETYLIYGRKKFPKKIDLAKNWNTKIFGRAAKRKSGLFKKNNLPGRSGFALSTADLNGDGMDDIIIGSPFSEGPQNKRRDAGVVSVIFGKKTLPKRISLSHNADVTILGARSEDYAGYSLATGDINGDGKYDILIGAPYGGSKTTREGNKIGRVYGIFGRSQFPLKIDLRKREGGLIIKGEYYMMTGMFGSVFGQNQAGYVGLTVSSGDVNNDGIDDIIIGSPNAVGLERYRKDASEIYIIYGKKLIAGKYNLQRKADVTIFGEKRGDISGHALSTGDINGDGINDIIIGAPGAITKTSKKRSKTGKVYVVYGTAAIEN